MQVDAVMRRRGVSTLLGAVGPTIAAKQALALIQDDDDAEMVARAKARRQERLKEEKKVEDEFLRSEGITNKRERLELVPITRAVSRLADLGQSISENNMVAVSSTLAQDGNSGKWIDDLLAKADSLSLTDDQKASAGALRDSFASMSTAVNSKDVSGLKRGYVTTVTALEKWSVDTNVAKFLRAQ
eukprot:CAMPEP_0167752890 /NCGR_PEP_ID=MMETSP0110_2-20121227/7397_1 /TAXON_ID=629695 /ORGANISM="Gymnochlora sp., Strain CCMP2014" /LENGTH=185 /DNA_ID=CAMNT_0007638571 /DNA_START=175 /DNA_END=732 /DNA_ORIENTATION=-